MVLKQDNYKEIINSYTHSDWKPLLDLIPRIEQSKSFGEAVGGGMDKEGVYHIAYSAESEHPIPGKVNTFWFSGYDSKN